MWEVVGWVTGGECDWGYMDIFLCFLEDVNGGNKRSKRNKQQKQTAKTNTKNKPRTSNHSFLGGQE
tara:strand:- start:156 stop:353 length:198 start_codon:yes stop_codon:yes gene_type:complete